MLPHEHTAQLGELVRRIAERAENRLAILDRGGDEHLVGLSATMSTSAVSSNPGVIQEPCEFEHVLVTHGNAGEKHWENLLRGSLDPEIEVDAMGQLASYLRIGGAGTRGG